ncbi:MAG: hypothetical protein PVF73_07125 [Bacteroidales bacterium]|jgi:hypothetical protein
MTKTSTFQFVINNLASKSEGEIVNADSLFDQHGEFKDVFDLLNQLDMDVRQEVIERIMNQASELE